MHATFQAPAPELLSSEATAPAASWGVQLTTALLSAWVLGGLFLDGWAHA